MYEPSQKEIKELIEAHGSRLHKLKERRAVEGMSADPAVGIEIEMIEDEISKLKKRRQWVSALGWRSYLMGFVCILVAVVVSLFIVGYPAPPRVKAQIQIVPPGDESFDVKCRDEIADGCIRVTLNLSRHSRDMLQSHVAEIKPPSGFEITCLTAAYYNPLFRSMSEISVIQEQEFRSLAIGYFRVVVYVKLIPKHGYDIKSYRDEDWTLRIDKESVQIQEGVDNE